MGVSASERIVNLALYLAAARRPVSARDIATQVAGYHDGQNEAAFGRMFERDKDDLRRAGFVIDVDRSDDTERYRFDPDATFSGTVGLSPVEAVELRAAAAAMISDPSFPYTDDLRLALAKITAAADGPIGSASAITSLSADEDPVAQGSAVASLTAAIAARKHASFAYTGAAGRTSRRRVEPWGLFAREGRWYLVAMDPLAEGVRVFAVTRIEGLEIDATKPKTADFERPEGFDVRAWMLMPFQYGPSRHEATLRLTGQAARRASALSSGQGTLSRAGGGVVMWRVPVADETLLARWVAANGPGIEIVAPRSLRSELESGLRRVVELHG